MSTSARAACLDAAKSEFSGPRVNGRFGRDGNRRPACAALAASLGRAGFAERGIIDVALGAATVERGLVARLE